jgi:hypothetical protein
MLETKPHIDGAFFVRALEIPLWILVAAKPNRKERRMYHFSIILSVSLVSIVCLSASGDSPSDELNTIPLDEIWGYELQGTCDFRRLEPKRATANLSNDALIRGSLVLQIYKALQSRPKPGEKAGPAFVVTGTHEDALKNAHALIVKKDKKEPPRRLPADKELSLLFYSYMGARYVRLVSVEQSDHLIKVEYQMVSHSTANSTIHFALIPLRKMRPGAVQVKIEQVPPVDEKGNQIPLRDERQIVCDSFTFVVEK